MQMSIFKKSKIVAVVFFVLIVSFLADTPVYADLGDDCTAIPCTVGVCVTNICLPGIGDSCENYPCPIGSHCNDDQICETDASPSPSLVTDDNSILGILDVVKRIINLFILSAGVVFVALIIISAYKFVASQGDPKAMQGAKNTITYAVIGFILVIGVYVILNIVIGVLGADIQVGGVFDELAESIKRFLYLFKVEISD